MPPGERAFVTDPDLLNAIGSVAVESAILDDFLREMIGDLVVGHELWILLEGQSTEWLCQTSRLLLHETDPHGDYYTTDQHERFNTLINRIAELRNLRNTVVHGTWRWGPSLGTEPDEIEDRPWGGPIDDTTYLCNRSRPRKIFHEQYFSVADVHRIADEIRDTCQAFVDLAREMRNSKGLGKYQHYGRWPSSVVDSDTKQ